MNKISLGDEPTSFILASGHTVGRMLYHVSEELFTGDTIFSEGSGSSNIPGGAANDLHETV